MKKSKKSGKKPARNGWLREMFGRFLKLPKHLIFMHIFAKLLFGLGLGMFLAGYFPLNNWQAWGLALMGLAILVSLPGAYMLMKK